MILEIAHLLGTVTILEITLQDCQFSNICLWQNEVSFLHIVNIKHIMGIPHNITGETVIEESNCTLNEILNKHKGVTKPHRDRLHCGFILNIVHLNANAQKTTVTERYWVVEKTAELNRPVYIKYVLT